MIDLARGQCPPGPGSAGATFAMPMPEGSHGTDDLLVVMSDDPPGSPTLTGITLPAVCGPVASWCPVPPTGGECLVEVSAGNPAVVVVCADVELIGTMPHNDRMIGVAAVEDPEALLHVVVKSNKEPYDSDDAFLALPIAHLSSSYRPMCYPGAGSNEARFAVVATSEYIEVRYSECDGSPGALSPMPLYFGDVFQHVCATSGECGGYPVQPVFAAPPFAGSFGLVCGATCAFVPVTSKGWCDTLLEMLPPPGWAGSEYLTTEFNKTKHAPLPGDLYRIMAHDTAVTITEMVVAVGGNMDGDPSRGRPCPAAPPFTLAPGQYCDVNIGSMTNGQFYGGRIKSSGARFMLGQYMKGSEETHSGDPSFMLVVPTTGFRCAYRFFSFAGYAFDPLDPAGHVDGSYVNIVAPMALIDTQVWLDGVPLGASSVGPLAQSIPGSGYSWRRCRLPNPCTTAPLPASCPYGEEHTVAAGVPVGAYVYGQRKWTQAAYAYPAGMAEPQ